MIRVSRGLGFRVSNLRFSVRGFDKTGPKGPFKYVGIISRNAQIYPKPYTLVLQGGSGVAIINYAGLLA